MNHNHPDDNRIPDDLLIPTIVTVLHQKEEPPTDGETGDEKTADRAKPQKGKGCCGCLVALVIFYLLGVLLDFIFKGLL